LPSRAHLERQRKRLEAELERRTKKRWDPRAILGANLQQLAVFDDPTRDRTLEGTRQLGKSFLAAVELIEAALGRPGSDSAFVDFDKEHAEKVILRDFERLIEEYDIPSGPRIVDERLEFDNGAKVYVFSGRASEVRKLQGLKFALLVCDESNDAEALEEIFKMVRPALIRFGGRVLAMGIPGRVAGIGFWWEITRGKLAKFFGQHRGHMRDNPFLPPEALAEQRAKAAEELGETSSDFRRHWDGVWPDLDDDLRVFKYRPDLNGYDGDAPVCQRYALGLDPGGVQDAEAAVILGHTLGVGQAWVVAEDDSGAGSGGSWDDTGRRLAPLIETWRPLDAFYDYGSAKKALGQVLDGDSRLRLEPVPMKDLDVEIPRLNKLFMTRKLWIRRGSRLERDLLYTTWDAKARAAGRNKYSSSWKQNLCDALRAALWAFEGYANPPEQELSPRERKQREIRENIERAETTDYSQLVDPGTTASPDPWS
jgi:hypothetical protein